MDKDLIHAKPAVQTRSQKSLKAILNSAEKLLRNGGLEAFTIPAVAEEAGVSLGGIYRRFVNRDALLLAVKERLVQAGLAELEAAMSKKTTNLSEALTLYVTSLVNGYADDEKLYGTILLANTMDKELQQSGLRLNLGYKLIFDRAFTPHHAEVAHANAVTALSFVREIIMSSVMTRLRVIAIGRKPETSWNIFSRELIRMTLGYLTTTK